MTMWCARCWYLVGISKDLKWHNRSFYFRFHYEILEILVSEWMYYLYSFCGHSEIMSIDRTGFLGIPLPLHPHEGDSRVYPYINMILYLNPEYRPSNPGFKSQYAANYAIFQNSSHSYRPFLLKVRHHQQTIPLWTMWINEL